jgi:hypothetical protein
MTYNGRIYNEEGRRQRPPLIRCFFVLALLACLRTSDVRGLAFRDQHVLVGCLNRKRVILLLEPNKLGFQVAYSLLEAAHLGNDAGIGTADVAE